MRAAARKIKVTASSCNCLDSKQNTILEAYGASPSTDNRDSGCGHLRAGSCEDSTTLVLEWPVEKAKKSFKEFNDSTANMVSITGRQRWLRASKRPLCVQLEDGLDFDKPLRNQQRQEHSTARAQAPAAYLKHRNQADEHKQLV